MPNFFDEAYMMEVLTPCLPEGEALLAAVKGTTLQVNQKKTSQFDVYVALTPSYLLVVECEERKYLNQFYHVPDLRKTVAQDVGTCFPLAEIARAEVKSGILGAMTCAVTLKNGSFLKLQLPKRAGLGNGMPRHLENRETILTRLRTLPQT